jgi:hypothetical protein
MVTRRGAVTREFLLAGNTARPARRWTRSPHNGAIDSYRVALVLRTSRGVAVVVLTNFGNANTEAVAQRAPGVLEATGAMKPREASVSTAFSPPMATWLAVYNWFDEAKLASILDRPVDLRASGGRSI